MFEISLIRSLSEMNIYSNECSYFPKTANVAKISEKPNLRLTKRGPDANNDLPFTTQFT